MNSPLKSICIVRLSAIGDVTHMVPVVRTVQKFWPETKLTWIIGKNEAAIVKDISDIEFIEIDKSNFLRSCKNLLDIMRDRKFDALICAQVSLRANIISALVPATIKLGYDRARSKDFHSLFTNKHIPPATNQHVLDSFFSFIEYFGLAERELYWGYKIPAEAQQFANQYVSTNQFKVVISPCSSHPLRNWTADRYAAVADYAINTHNAQVFLCGSSTQTEQQIGADIERKMHNKAINLIGKDTLKKFLALLKQANVLITPDSGPAHIATGLRIPVIGLYAASNPKRSGPYLSQQWCVDKYDEAAHLFRNKPASQLKWGTKLEHKGVMNLIEVNDVTEKLDALVKQHTSH